MDRKQRDAEDDQPGYPTRRRKRSEGLHRAKPPEADAAGATTASAREARLPHEFLGEMPQLPLRTGRPPQVSLAEAT